MRDLRFWKHFLQIGIYTLLAYCCIGYIVLATTILHFEYSLLQPTKTAIAPSSEKNHGSIVSTRIHNIFGDQIPHAVVHIEGKITQADSTGHFSMEGISPGRYRMDIYAGGYQHYQWNIQVEQGTNTPIIKYDSGLWPEYFLPDLHMFSPKGEKIFGVIGFANGADYPLYINRATIINPKGLLIMDILQENDGFEYFTTLSGKLSFVDKPQAALKIPAKTYVIGDLPIISGPAIRGTYHIEIHIGNENEHNRNEYRVLRIKDDLIIDSNWNPHLP